MRTALHELVRDRGSLSFREFMAHALYDPDHGYYSTPTRPRVGKGGDFITSVSVGNTFGRLLARRLHHFWTANGCPGAFHLLEPGPEGGNLALDILGEARTSFPEFHRALHYHACEPSAEKRRTLTERFRDAGEPRAMAISAPPSLDPTQGIGAVLANEILDALPVHLLRFENGDWKERCVTMTNGHLAWTDRNISHPPLATAARTLGKNFPDRYDTEICLEHGAFLAPLANAFDSSLLIFIDYGYPQHEYYHPSRSEGTLRTYHCHQAGDDPLTAPGQQDISAHVDFTRVLAAGRDLGLTPLGFTRQERYLTALAAPLLTALPPDSPETSRFVRQFRTLTHPGMLGAAFHILEFSKGPVQASLEPFQFDPEGLQRLHPD